MVCLLIRECFHAERKGQQLAFKELQEEGLVHDTSEVSQSVRSRTRKRSSRSLGRGDLQKRAQSTMAGTTTAQLKGGQSPSLRRVP